MQPIISTTNPDASITESSGVSLQTLLAPANLTDAAVYSLGAQSMEALAAGRANQRAPSDLGPICEEVRLFADNPQMTLERLYRVCPASFRHDFIYKLFFVLVDPSFWKYPCPLVQTFVQVYGERILESPHPLQILLNKFLFNTSFDFYFSDAEPYLKMLLKEPDSLSIVSYLIYSRLCMKRELISEEERFLDEVMPFFFSKNAPDAQILEVIRRRTPLFCKHMLMSAIRHKYRGGTPYDFRYTQCIASYVISSSLKLSERVEMLVWLATPFIQSRPGALIHLLVTTKLAKDPKIEAIISIAIFHCDPEEAFEIASLNLSNRHQENLLDRFFSLGAELFCHEGWNNNFKQLVIPLIVKLKQGYLSPSEIEVFKGWLLQVPGDLSVLRKILYFPDFPCFWEVFCFPLEKLSPESPLMRLFKKAVVVWPTLRISANVELPAAGDIASQNLMTRTLYAVQFPQNFQMPKVDKSLLKDTLSFANADGISDVVYYQYQNRFNPEVREHISPVMTNGNSYGTFQYTLLSLVGSFEIVRGKNIESSVIESFTKLIETIISSLSKLKMWSIRSSTNLIRILGQIAEIYPEVFDLLEEDLSPCLLQALDGIRTYQEKIDLCSAVYALYRIKPQLFRSIICLEPFVTPPITAQDHFFATAFGFHESGKVVHHLTRLEIKGRD